MVYTLHIIPVSYNQQQLAANDRLLILCDHTLLQLGTQYVAITIGCTVYKHSINTDDGVNTCIYY